MKIAGIDVSTRAIDLVLLDLDTDQAEWERFELLGDDLFQRLREIPDVWPHRLNSRWESVIAIGIEQPAGHHGAFKVSMAFGAVVSLLPKHTVTKPWLPSEWRKACGMKGNATKEDVGYFVSYRRDDELQDWTQDAADAYCIAWATRSVLEPLEQKAAA